MLIHTLARDVTYEHVIKLNFIHSFLFASCILKRWTGFEWRKAEC